GGAAFVDALRQQTKLGAVLLSSDRLDRLADAFVSASPEDWDEMREALGRFDLKPEDWRELLRGEVGFAVALEPWADREPLVVGLGWLDVGEDVSRRLLAALQAVVAEQADEPHALVRDDLQIAGIDVTHLAGPILTTETPKIDFTPGAGGELSEDEIQQRITEHQQRLQEAPREETDRMHFFLARLEGRLLWGMTFPQSSSKVRAMRKAGDESIDWDEVTGLEAATAMFGRFLSGQNGASTGRVAGLLATPGVGEQLPAGTTLIEIVGDPRPLVKLADLDSTGQAQRAIEALGLGSLGPLALRTSLDGSVLRSAVALSAPAPRSGVVALLDQDTLTPDPPAWVPASANEYQEISFDLAKAYASLKQLAGQQGGQRGSQAFDQIETVAKLFTGADLTALLASLGRQFSIVSFPSKSGAQRADDEAGQAASSVRLGIVVPVNDEQIWKRLLDHFASSGAGGLHAVEEQGFNGYRMSAGGQDLGVFLATSHLMIGIGPGVSESLLSVLRTPPEAGAALRTSGVVERARSLMPLEKCLSYSLAGASSGADLRQELLSLIDQLASPVHLVNSSPPYAGEPDAPNPEAEAFFNKLKELLPTDGELEGAVGVSVDQTIVSEQGLLIRSALELPSP
ncbi:MAG TPA: hypothetical protein VFW87_27440, partial [Pirellulales bacterium]|nr:hypothetical protein [Pirellulales bacterium]